jgi:hypothetical protein
LPFLEAAAEIAWMFSRVVASFFLKKNGKKAGKRETENFSKTFLL